MKKSGLVVLLIIFVFSLSSCKDNLPASGEETDFIIINNELTDADNEISTTYTEVTETGFNIDSDLEVKDLIRQYYDYMALGEYELATYLTNDSSRLSKNEFVLCGDYIDSVKSLSCYVMEGMVEGTYIVVAKSGMLTTYGNEIINRLESFYVCTNESGTMFISGGGVSDEVKSYNSIMVSQATITDFIKTSKEENEQALLSNPELAKLQDIVFEDNLIRFLYERPLAESKEDVEK